MEFTTIVNLTSLFSFYYPYAFLKKEKGRRYCIASIRPSVMLSPTKQLDEIQPNLVCVCVCVTHMNRVCNSRFLCPAPWDPGEGSKGQMSLNVNYKVIFIDFYTKLCVCSQKGKILNISNGICILSPGPCPRGWTLGRQGGSKIFVSNMVI